MPSLSIKQVCAVLFEPPSAWPPPIRKDFNEVVPHAGGGPLPLEKAQQVLSNLGLPESVIMQTSKNLYEICRREIEAQTSGLISDFSISQSNTKPLGVDLGDKKRESEICTPEFLERARIILALSLAHYMEHDTEYLETGNPRSLDAK